MRPAKALLRFWLNWTQKIRDNPGKTIVINNHGITVGGDAPPDLIIRGHIVETDNWGRPIKKGTAMPILDGERVKSSEIDAAKHHVLIGKFRDPDFATFLSKNKFPPRTKCECGAVFYVLDTDPKPANSDTSAYMQAQIFDHWQRGHFDESIYQTLWG